MSEHQSLLPSEPWIQLTTTPEDWRAADPSLLATMLGQLHLIRAFEEAVLELAGEGLVHGPAHSSIGQEGGAVGSVIGLSSTDGVNGTHRGHHQFLAKVINHVSGGKLDLANLGYSSDGVSLSKTKLNVGGGDTASRIEELKALGLTDRGLERLNSMVELDIRLWSDNELFT